MELQRMNSMYARPKLPFYLRRFVIKLTERSMQKDHNNHRKKVIRSFTILRIFLGEILEIL